MTVATGVESGRMVDLLAGVETVSDGEIYMDEKPISGLDALLDRDRVIPPFWNKRYASTRIDQQRVRVKSRVNTPIHEACGSMRRMCFSVRHFWLFVWLC